MTLPTPPPPEAAFVGARERPRNSEGDPAMYFRREFDVAPGLRSAKLLVTALGLVETHLNSERVGDEVLEPGWTSYRNRLAVREHDVTSRLHVGRNALGAVVGEGWALGRLGYEAIARRHIYAERLALFVVLRLDYPDRVEHVVGDEHWRAGAGGVRQNGIYDGETFDARREPAGWCAPGFDDRDWGRVEPVDWDLSTLVLASAPPIRRIEELHPVDVFQTARGTTVVDFGQNIAGWVRLRTKGPAATTVTVRHAEILVNGVPDYETLRAAEATDTFILAGSGVEVFEPRFTFHGFRYAELSGLATELAPDDICAVVVHSDMPRTGWFECSDDLVNRLHSNVVWSMRGNFVGIPTDCPQRDERLGWTGDLNAFAATATFLYDVRGVLDSWLEDLRLEQRERGFVPYVVPDVQNGFDQPTALWSDVAVSLPWALYQRYGDIDLLRRSYDSMAAFTRSVEERLDPSGRWSAGFQFGDWLDPDAPLHNPMRGKTDPDLVATAYFYKVAIEMAETSRVLGHEADAADFADLSQRVRGGFRQEYVTPSGRVAQESATAYALAICFGLLDEQQMASAGKRLARIVRGSGHRISTGFAGTPLVAHALSETGYLDDAYRLLLQTEPPSFLYPVTQGATTIWERWDAVLPDGSVNRTGMTSLNHYALGAVADWLHTVVGGVQSTSPAHRTMRIAPQPGGGLTRARTVLETVHGRVEAAWQLDGRHVDVQVEIPEGTSAIVVLPLHPDEAEIQIDPGRHAWDYDMASDPGMLSITSTIEELASHDDVWSAVIGVLQPRVPHVPVGRLLLINRYDTLSDALDHLPSISPEVRAEVERTVTTRQGVVSA